MKHGVQMFLVESGVRFPRDRVVQAMGNQGLAESPLEVVLLLLCDAIDHPRKHRATGAAKAGGRAHVGGGASVGEVETRPAEGTGFRGRLTQGQALA